MKPCIHCGEVKPLTEFYAHPKMSDGHLNKCKPCARAYTKKRTEKLSTDITWVEAEMRRHREWQRQNRARGNGQVSPLQKAASNRRYNLKYPEKAAARNKTGRALKTGALKPKPCAVCCNPNTEAHHEDYSRPLDVMWLCDRHHKERHVQMRMEARRLKHS